MKCKSVKMAFILLFAHFSTSVLGQPVVYHLENAHSSIQFTIPFFGVSEVTGRFDQFCGEFIYDAASLDKSKIELYILSSSIDTSAEMRDKDLRGNYFESAKYPIIKFISTEIKSSDGKEFDVKGLLSLHGVTKDVSFHLKTIGQIISPKGNEWGLKALPILLDRTDYGINKGQMSGDRVFVGNEVTLSVTVRLRENTSDKKTFEQNSPVADQKGIDKFAGAYSNAGKGASISFLFADDKLFVIYHDNDFVWMHEAVQTSASVVRILSFNDLIEMKENSIVLKEQGKADVIFLKN